MFFAKLLDELVSALYFQPQGILGELEIQRMRFAVNFSFLFQPVGFIVVVQNVISAFVVIVVVFGLDVHTPTQLIFLHVIDTASVVGHAECPVEQINIHGNIGCLYVEAVIKSGRTEGTNVQYRMCEQLVEKVVDIGQKRLQIRPVDIIHVQHSGIIQQCKQFPIDNQMTGIRVL